MHNCMRRPTALRHVDGHGHDARSREFKKTAFAEALQIGLVEEIQNLLGAEAIGDLDFEALETAVRDRTLQDRCTGAGTAVQP